jgi:hypothetical protein
MILFLSFYLFSVVSSLFNQDWVDCDIFPMLKFSGTILIQLDK